MNRRTLLKLAALLPFSIPGLAKALAKPSKSVGSIMWDYQPPANICWHVHKFSMLDSLQTARNFLFASGGNGVVDDQVLVVSPQFATIIVILPHFFPTAKTVVVRRGQRQMLGRLAFCMPVD